MYLFIFYELDNNITFQYSDKVVIVHDIFGIKSVYVT